MGDSVRIVVKAPHVGITFNVFTHHSATVATVLTKLAQVLRLQRDSFCLVSPQKKILRAWRQLSEYQVIDGSVLFALKLTPTPGKKSEVLRSYYHKRALEYFSRVPNHGFLLPGSWLESTDPQTLSAIDGLMFIFANNLHTNFTQAITPKLHFLLENTFIWNVILQSCEQFATSTERFWVVAGNQRILTSRIKTKIKWTHNGTNKAFTFDKWADVRLHPLATLESLVPELQEIQSVDDLLRQSDRYTRNVLLERRDLESLLAKVSLLIRKPRIVDVVIEALLKDNGLIFRGSYEAFRTDEEFSDNVEIMVRFAEEFGRLLRTRHICVAIRLALIDFKKLIVKSMKLYEPTRKFEPELGTQSPHVAGLQAMCDAGGDLLRVYPCILSRPYCYPEQGFIVGGLQEPFLGGDVSNSIYVFYNHGTAPGPRRVLTARLYAGAISYVCHSSDQITTLSLVYIALPRCFCPRSYLRARIDEGVRVVPRSVLPWDQEDDAEVDQRAALLDALLELGFTDQLKNCRVLRNSKYVLGDAVKVLLGAT